MRPFFTFPSPGDRSDGARDLQDILHTLAGLNLLDPNQDPGDGSLASGTDWRRRFADERREQWYGPATELRVKQFQAQHLQGQTPTGRVDAKVAHAMERLLEENQLLDDGTRLAVLGQVTDSNGDPREDVKLTFADEDLRHPQQFRRGGQPVSVRTNGQGFYRFEYSPEDFALADGSQSRAADLLVRVLDEDDQELASARPQRWPVRRVEVIDVTVPIEEVQPTEFERLEQWVPPLLVGQGKLRLPAAEPPGYDDLRPHEVEERDYPHLERKTGLASEWLQAWVAAAKMERVALQMAGDADVVARVALMTQGRAFFYAWCREARVAELAAVLQAGSAEWQAVRQRAQVGRRAEFDDREAASLFETFEWLQRLSAFDVSANPGSLLGRAFALTPNQPSPTALTRFLAVLEGKETDLTTLSGQDQRALQGLGRTIELLGLCDGHEDLTRALDAELKDVDPANRIAPLALWTSDQWKGQVEKAAGPSGTAEVIAGLGGVETTARVLQARAEVVAPSVALVARLEAGALALPAIDGMDHAQWKTLLGEASVAVDRLVQGAGIAEPGMEKIQSEPCRRYLQRLGGFARLGLGLECASRLMSQNVQSVAALASYGPDVIRQQLMQNEPAELVNAVTAHLERMTEASGMVLSNIVSMGGGPLQALLHRAQKEAQQPANELARNYSVGWRDDAWTNASTAAIPDNFKMTAPSLPGMFGDLSECACAPSESIFGVPSYLVDLLGLLKQVPVNRGTFRTAREAFFARQPHVQHLELGRENAEIELPHIDLALEVLEWHAAKRHLFVSAPDGTDVAAWFGNPSASQQLRDLLLTSCQHLGAAIEARRVGETNSWIVTDGMRRWDLELTPFLQAPSFLAISGISLRRSEESDIGFAEPAHRVPMAYQTLSRAKFPLDLPFDRDQAEAEAFEARLGLSAHEVLSALPQPDETRSKLTESCRRIGMSAAMATLLQEPLLADPQLWTYWGESGPAGADPDSGEPLPASPRERLSRASVLRARTGLELPQLEAALATRYVGELQLMPRDACKASEMMVVAGDRQPVSGGHFDRLQRFVRWWRHVPQWSAALLDSVLIAAGDDALDRIAGVQSVVDLLKVSPESAASLLLSPLRVVVDRPTADARPRTMFERVFLNSRLDTASRSAIAAMLDPNWQGPREVIQGRFEAAVATALGLKPAQVRDLHAGLMLPPELAPKVLSSLWAASQLASASKLEPAEWVAICRAVNAPINHRHGLQDLQTLATLCRTVRDSGLPVARAVQVLAMEFPVPRQGDWALKLQDAARPAHVWIGTDSELAERALMQLHATLGEPHAAELMAALAQRVPQITPELLKLLTQARPGGLQRPLFRSEADLIAAFPLDRKTRQQNEHLLDRLREAGEGWLDEIERTLKAYLEPDQIEAVALALRFDPSANDAASVRARAVAALTQPSTGVPPLLPPEEAKDLVRDLKKGETAATRVRRMQTMIAPALRDHALLSLMREQTGWDEALASAFLTERMPLDEAGTTARSVLLNEAFWRRSPEGAPLGLPEGEQLALDGWFTRLGMIRLLRDELAGLPALEGWNWFQIVDGEHRTDSSDWTRVARRRSELFALLALASPDRLGLAALADLGRAWRQLGSRFIEPGLDSSPEVVLAKRLRISEEDLKHLPAGRLPSELLALCDRAVLLRQHKLSSADLLGLAGDDQAERARVARLALARKVGAAAWPDMLRSVQDTLRNRQRDALVGYLLHNPPPGVPRLRRPDDLYEHLLIDTQMQPCFRTTRILQAVASVQLFVQRILAGLEPDIPATDPLRQRWTWMRSYRLWEANRRVFAYPENLLLPELLDRKSEALIKLEGRIRQGELDADEAREAFAEYLGDIGAAGQTVVVGMHDDDSNPNKRTLYVLGRAPNEPLRYFWRKCEGFGGPLPTWTPWRRIELDIKVQQVAPVVLGGELYVVWVDFAREEGNNNARKCVATARWSRFNGRSWSEPDESAERISLPVSAGRDERTGFAVRVEAVGPRGAALHVFAAQSNEALAQELPGDRDGPIDRREGGDAATGRIRRWVQIEAWIKLRSAEGQLVYLKRQSGIGTLSSTAVDTVNGSKAIFSGEFWNLEDAARTGINPHDISPELEYRNVRYPATSSKRVPGVQSERTVFGQTVWRVFEFDLSRGGKTASELGFPQVDEAVAWLQCASIQLQAGRSGRWSTTDAMRILASPNATRPSVVGYREVRPFANEVVLKLPGAFSGPVVFVSRNDEPFTLVSANAVATTGSVQQGAISLAAACWYVSEGTARRLVDLQGSAVRLQMSTAPEVTVAGVGGTRATISHFAVPGALGMLAPFDALPDNFDEALGFRGLWLEKSDLTALQTGQFGSELAPQPGPNVNRSIWPEPTDGARWAKLAFDERMPYAVYNWEAFLHAPLMIADHLTKNHKFELAEWWLRLVFDPTRSNPDEFLRCKGLRGINPLGTALTQLSALAAAKAGAASDDVSKIAKLVEEWRDNPFRPFMIARGRPSVFLWSVGTSYIENLFAWADALYRRNTRESTAEATLLYVQIGRMLGPRPRYREAVAPKARFSYAEVDSLGSGLWDAFGNAWVPRAAAPAELFVDYALQHANHLNSPPAGALYFCVPPNDRLLRYWDLVEQRLFNIRHCRNIDGLAQTLPLLDAPIDPELLARAVAAGLDLDDVVSGLYAAPPTHRYAVLAARAADLVNEAKSLGGALLSALEKRDAEKLQMLRTSHEIDAHRRAIEVRSMQVDEATKQLEILRINRDTAVTRLQRYRFLLGEVAGPLPAEGDVGGQVPMLGGTNGLTVKNKSLGLIVEEVEQEVGLKGAYDWSTAAGVTKAAAGVVHIVSSGFAAAGNKTVAEVLTAVAHGGTATADAFNAVSAGWRYYADSQSMRAGHLRRREEWAFQGNQAVRELRQIDRQILAAQIRLDIAAKELSNQQRQQAEAEATHRFLSEKFTRAELYDWMVGELRASCRAAYQMALDLARRAERAARRELGTPDINIIRNDYWNGYRAGLMAGEKLSLDLKRLEIKVLELNRREHEMSKHVSLRRLQPQALIDLLATGTCEFELPEWLFDLDMPGHYMRRLKAVSLSIPCVVGPYASVNCRLTLLRSEVRTTSLLRQGAPAGGYLPRGIDDDRFVVSFHGTESIVTSSGRDDSGLFETNLRDERYLPFEHAGAISRWRLELPSLGRQFDPATLSDVILHLRYTARDGGQTLGEAAAAALDEGWSAESSTEHRAVVVSARMDHPAEWAQARAASQGPLVIEFTSTQVLPYWMQARELKLVTPCQGFKLIAEPPGRDTQAVAVPVSGLAVTPIDPGPGLRVVVSDDDWRTAEDVLLLFTVATT